jgi:hypothetical protein
VAADPASAEIKRFFFQRLESPAARQLRAKEFLAQFTGLTLDAPAVTLLSKYALDYAPGSLAAAASASLPFAFRISPRLEYRRRQRQVSREQYVLLDVRVERRLSPLLDVYVDGANLLDRAYSEVAGVPMPGATMTVSVAIGR